MEVIVQWIDLVKEYVKIITIFDIIDVSIVAYVVYRVMLLLKGSRSAQVAKAILLIVGLLWISYQFHLNVINFIVGKAVELGTLALIIVFQPELRRFLEQVGSKRLGDVFSKEQASPDELESAITQTTVAYTALSRDKIGALTVFERSDGLDDVIKTGTVIDATVSSELLKNIFWPKAPMHDGAVIIRNGRVAGAGCMLPLSGNVNLSRDLGMRHRAGIGMSEHTDAVVAIVSEETGSISVAVSGMLKRHLAPETLERLLRNELIPKQEETAAPKFLLTSLFRSKKGGDPNGQQNQ
jgi:diadenylate cyclase